MAKLGALISFGHLINKNDNRPIILKYFEGDYHHVSTSPEYYSIVNNRGSKDLIFIHNHPNGSSFSGADLLELTGVNNLVSVVAVGNRHNLYVIIDVEKNKSAFNKINNYVADKIKQTKSMHRKEFTNEAAHLILDNPEDYGLLYIKYRRKTL